MNMNEFRSKQPLSEDEFAAIRRNVMTAIAARNQRRFLPIAMRFAFAAVVVIAIVVVLIRRPAPVLIETAKKPLVIEKAPIAAAVIAPPQVVRVAHHPRHHRATQARAQYASNIQQNIRLEFRTSDPDVRIIWIASQTPSKTTGGNS
jgi:hypothetical protein